MQLFYKPEINQKTDFFNFDKDESKHIVKVLRKQENDILHVTNGSGLLVETKIILASDSKCTVEIITKKIIEKSNRKLHIAVAPTKMNERFEWFLEKATEVGIAEITPIICSRSERKQVNTERFQKIILAAMKQSNQCYLPKLNEPISYSNFIKNNAAIESQKYIAHCEELSKKTLKESLKPIQDIIILIGPEGDFSENEIKTAMENNYQPITLGNNRLRTETAAIVACTIVNFEG